MFLSGHVFVELEGFGRHCLFAVWQTRQGPRKCQTNVARVFRLPERTPLGKLSAIEDLRQIAHLGQILIVVPTKELWTRGADKWCICRGGDAGNFLEQRHVLRMVTELIISDHRSERMSAKGAVLLFINLLEEG